FTQDSLWYWASAGKTLTAFTVGIAQEKNLVDIDNRTSLYLGEGWTSAPLEKEEMITVRNQLTMTSGLEDTAFDCVTPDCLQYLTDAGTRWAYHNGPYTLLQNVVSEAVNTSWSAFFNTHLRNKIGMSGFWASTNGANSVYFSNARSMARFGLLNLNEGVWDEETILSDTDFINRMVNTSQDLNKAYGYLWWLNGKESYMAPAVQATFNGELIPNAPDDTFSGLGKNDQKLYVIPSKGLVIVRLGEDTGESLLGPSSFDNELWEKINALIN
ncbi:MAG: serine hydrolase domain-containing protein, partial [Flavobacteriaceae bacterium]